MFRRRKNLSDALFSPLASFFCKEILKGGNGPSCTYCFLFHDEGPIALVDRPKNVSMTLPKTCTYGEKSLACTLSSNGRSSLEHNHDWMASAELVPQKTPIPLTVCGMERPAVFEKNSQRAERVVHKDFQRLLNPCSMKDCYIHRLKRAWSIDKAERALRRRAGAGERCWFFLFYKSKAWQFLKVLATSDEKQMGGRRYRTSLGNNCLSSCLTNLGLALDDF
ncbi:hypothetical protein Tco_0365134 [Tanacetum coccineum]